MDKAFQKPRLYESSVNQTLACSCLRQSTVFIISIRLAASFIMDTSFHQGCAQTCKSASGLALSGGCPYCSNISEHDLIFHRSCSFCFFCFPQSRAKPLWSLSLKTPLVLFFHSMYLFSLSNKM